VNNNWSDEETDNPLRADDRNFYKVEKWTKDGTKIDQLLYAGNNLERARDVFANAIKHRPRTRLTIRQRTRVKRAASGSQACLDRAALSRRGRLA
jgi:hypothetical protein